MGVLLTRRYCNNDGFYGGGGGYYCGSPWLDWGRWVALAVIVAFGFIVFFVITCVNARRRRRHGQNPLPGTAWLAGPPPGQYYHQDPNYPPPPQYSPNPTPAPGYYAAPQQGYFGGQQQSGIELQQPPNVYHAGDPVYPPPPGPPPPKE